MVWVDRTGVARQVGPVKNYHHPALSPDGRRIAVTIEKDIWVYDLERESLTPVTFNGGYRPIWIPDGKRLTYQAPRDGAINVIWKNADGSGDEEQLTRSPNNQLAGSWSPVGRLLAFEEFHPRTNRDIWLLDVAGGRKLRCFLCTDAPEGAPAFSPDGQWLAYRSFVSGPWEIYVRRVDGAGEKHQISNGIGHQPLWSRDGKQLFYWKGQWIGRRPALMQMMAVDVALGPVFQAGKPRALFEGRYRWYGVANYDVTPDGQRFLMLQSVQSAPIIQLELVVNWFDELRARVRPSSR